jgi:outer membrane lipopolysaccharide assembly protein LptE/RlpB
MRKAFKTHFILTIAAGMLLINSGCGFYSHTGASIPPDAKTFSISYITNTASIVAPSLSQTLTEKLKTKFINETQLKLTTGEGDILFSGKIIDYKTAPVAVQSNNANAVNRLTVTAEITYENRKDEKKNFTQTFTNFVDYSADKNFSAEEVNLINQVTDMMVQDIFNKAFINW